MFKLRKWTQRAVFAGAAALAVLFAIIYTGGWETRGLQAAATAPSLGAAQSFAVLAAAGITNTGPTVITGDLGTHPTAAVTGFFGTTANDGPGIVNGAIHQADAAALAARTALTNAYITTPPGSPQIFPWASNLADKPWCRACMPRVPLG